MHATAAGLVLVLALAMGSGAAEAAMRCRSDALGTARQITVDAATSARIGRKHFAGTLPLQPGEVVLTFDDGPHPPTTAAILAVLAAECVKATFFVVGRQVDAAPGLLRRIAADGHTIGTHTYSHALLGRLPTAAAEAEIDRGFAAAARALGPRPGLAPFFRFPGFESTPALLERLAARGLVVFGADFWASDWRPMQVPEQLELFTRRLAAANGGIALLHDTKAQTTAMLPALFAVMKQRGYRVVHAVPAAQAFTATPRSRYP
jgi:peptidoglycan/xylan/chitin deacetylase (PgdA/CDA1 family)